MGVIDVIVVVGVSVGVGANTIALGALSTRGRLAGKDEDAAVREASERVVGVSAGACYDGRGRRTRH